MLWLDDSVTNTGNIVYRAVSITKTYDAYFSIFWLDDEKQITDNRGIIVL